MQLCFIKFIFCLTEKQKKMEQAVIIEMAGKEHERSRKMFPTITNKHLYIIIILINV